jgi:hypothetical protein
MTDKHHHAKSMFKAPNKALKSFKESAFTHHPAALSSSVPGYATLLKASDFVAPESMSLGLKLDDIMPSARAGGSCTAKQRDREKYGMTGLDKPASKKR